MVDPVFRGQMEVPAVTPHGDSAAHVVLRHLQHRQHMWRVYPLPYMLVLHRSLITIAEQDLQDGGLGAHDSALIYVVSAITALVSISRPAFSPNAGKPVGLTWMSVVIDGGVVDKLERTDIQIGYAARVARRATSPPE